MHNFIPVIYPISHLVLALTEWILIGWSIYLWRQFKSPAMIVLPILLASISYDNLVLGTGNLIGEGNFLRNLSVGRFFLHDIVIPLFLPIGVELAYHAGAKWVNRWTRILSWVFALGLAGVNIADELMGLDLVPIRFLGTLRYVLATINGPPIITILVTLFVLLIGLALWVRLRWSGLFLGSTIALLGNAIPSNLVGTLPGSTAEFILALFLLLTEQQILFVHRQIPTKEPSSNERLTWEDEKKKNGYTVYQSGHHIQGNFIQVFVPDVPCSDAQGRVKLITYLHGFALCLPKFYEKHLELLAQQGYYVFFPDFQKSDYPDDIDQGALVPSQNKRHLYFWYQMAMDIIAQRNDPTTDEIPEQEDKANELYRIIEASNQPNACQCFFIALTLVVIISAVRLIYLFNPKYSKNLIKLISTVGLSLLYSPTEWIKGSIRRTSKAWNTICQDNPQLKETAFDFYVFGHSLGGLLALSWPAYVTDPKFQPKQILTADPAPSTEMGIPGIAIFILKLFRSPFTLNPITIKNTGPKLNVPVGILHGVDDTLVKPQTWVKPSLFATQTNFDYISSPKKKIYFSLSNKQDNPPLVAFHNQAVTDTTYFDNELFNSFGGVKEDPNAYNYQYIWPGLHFVVENQVDANDLFNKFPLETIHVSETLPSQSSNLSWIIVLVVFVLGSFAYWLWQSGTFAFSV